MLLRRTIAIAVMIAAGGAAARAQVRADPGVMIGGRVAVRVYVTLSDDETPYVPISGVSLRFFRTTADTTVVVRTDGAGSTTAMLVPGEYRLVSSTPVDWKGSRYSWSQLVQIRPGVATIELTAATAAKSEMVADPGSSVTGTASAGGSANESDARVTIKKDPAMATMLSFFLTGTGQMYSGQPVKGAGLLALTAVGVGVAAKQLSCATASDCKSTTGGMAIGAAGMVAFFGSWLYGIMDAGDAARRFNLMHGLASADVQPLVVPATGGRTRLGFSVAIRR